MTAAFSTPHNRIGTLIFLTICAGLAIASASVGISDNPTGILLALFSTTAFVLAFVHHWKTARQFRRFFYAAALGFIVFGLLHNVFEGIALNLGRPAWLQKTLNASL